MEVDAAYLNPRVMWYLQVLWNVRNLIDRRLSFQYWSTKGEKPGNTAFMKRIIRELYHLTILQYLISSG
jgi:hypothetical protein